MSTMVLELYDALKEAGASEANARRAAEAILQGDTSRLERIEDAGKELRSEIAELRQELGGMRRQIGQLSARVATLTWMSGLANALILLVLGKLFLVR